MIAQAFTNLGAWAWVILGLILMGVELLAPGVFFIWLGLAALVTGALDGLLDLSWQAAALVFAVLSLIAVIAGRAITRPRLQPDTQPDLLNQRAQAFIGRVFTLETPIKHGEGRIRVGASSWRVTGADRFAGAKVRVVRIDGTTLVVDDP